MIQDIENDKNVEKELTMEAAFRSHALLNNLWNGFHMMTISYFKVSCVEFNA